MAVQTKKSAKNEIKDFTGNFLMDAVQAGYEVKEIDGVLRCNYYVTENGTTTKTEIKFNPKTNALSSQIKIQGQGVQSSLSGTVQDWNELEGDFNEKVKQVLSGSIKRQELLSKLDGLTDEQIAKLIEGK